MLIIECDRCTEEFENSNLLCPNCERMRLEVMGLVKELSEESGITATVR